VPVRRRPVGEAHPHAAEPEGRDFQAAGSKLSLLHLVPFRARHEPERRRPRLGARDGVDDACGEPSVLRAVGGVDLVVDLVRLDELDVLLDAAGLDACFVARPGSADPRRLWAPWCGCPKRRSSSESRSLSRTTRTCSSRVRLEGRVARRARRRLDCPARQQTSLPIFYRSHLMSAALSSPQTACPSQIALPETPIKRAHNPEVAGSNPAPGYNKTPGNRGFCRFLERVRATLP
jgi:hypothetical protein